MVSVKKIVVIGLNDRALQTADFLQSQGYEVVRSYLQISEGDVKLAKVSKDTPLNPVVFEEVDLTDVDWIILSALPWQMPHRFTEEVADELFQIEKSKRPILTIQSNFSAPAISASIPDEIAEKTFFVNFFGNFEEGELCLAEIVALPKTSALLLLEFRYFLDQNVRVRTIRISPQNDFVTHRLSLAFALIPLRILSLPKYSGMSLILANAAMRRIFGVSPFEHYEKLPARFLLGFTERSPFRLWEKQAEEVLRSYLDSDLESLFKVMDNGSVWWYSCLTNNYNISTPDSIEAQWFSSGPSPTAFLDIEKVLGGCWFSYAEEVYAEFMGFALNLVTDIGTRKIYPAAIDHICEYGFGFPMGPFRLLQMHGVSHFLDILKEPSLSVITPAWITSYSQEGAQFYDEYRNPQNCFFLEDDQLRKKRLRDTLKTFGL